MQVMKFQEISDKLTSSAFLFNEDQKFHSQPPVIRSTYACIGRRLFSKLASMCVIKNKGALSRMPQTTENID